MNNDELDKILKQKLKNKIKPPKEFEQKIENIVNEQKAKTKDAKQSKRSKLNYQILKFTSVAAMVVVIFTVGLFYNKNSEQEDETIAIIKAIEPTKSESGILENDSEFLIYTEDEASVESVQKSLYIEPALEYTITKTANSNEYKLTFKQNIPDNTIVKLQYVKDQITEDSWAYQTSDKLSITETFPENNASTVSTKSTIEIEFSYASVENLEEYVEISPYISGTWEHLGKIWRFTPSSELESEETYTIKINSGIKAEDQTMSESYVFSFSTYGDSDNVYSSNLITADGIYTAKSDEFVKIYYTSYFESNDIEKVEIRKFSSADNFINYLENNDYEEAVSQGEYEFSDNSEYLQLGKTLQNGYYVAIIQNSNGKKLFNYPIQINDISAYAIETEKDVLTWVADSDGNLAKNINVEYQGKTEKTNSQGIAKFEDISDSSEKIKYMKIGNDENKLVVGVYNYTSSNYPNAYLYTDRTLYKNTDTINIWGFVPKSLFYDEVEDEFYIELDNEGKQKVEVGEDGNLNYSIELKNHIDNEYCYVYLYYKDTVIAEREITIENYELQNYTYEQIATRNYAYVGENYEFGVKVTSITGLVVPNKNVIVSYNGTEYKEKTDEYGIAHFSLNIELDDGEDYSSSQEKNAHIEIYNGDEEEYTEAKDEINLYILSRDIYTKIENEDNKYNITLNKLQKDTLTVIKEDISEIFDGIYDTEVELELIENKVTTYISGYEYNEYTKQNEPVYSIIEEITNTDITTIKTENGSFEYDTDSITKKESTEDTNYYYDLIIMYNDRNGNTVEDRINYIASSDDDEDELNNSRLGYLYWDDENSDEIYNISKIMNESCYYTYRYLLKRESDEKFSIGDTVSFKLAESTQSGETEEIQNNGKVLMIVFKEDISQTEIIENNDINYTFKDSDFPGCKITSVYFLNGKFYRMPIYYYDFDETDKTVDIEITADKESYEPGDEVTLTIKTTNNGKGIKSFVNVSVVNEAVFYDKSEDDTKLIESIYESKEYPIYTYSSFSDYIMIENGEGGKGGDGGIRSDFGDTAYFGTAYTNNSGVATVKFKLPDNVTTYRVTAQSANEDLYLGENSIDITSTLDFYVQSSEPRQVKTTDDLVLTASSISDTTYNVDFEFTIEELNKTLKTSANTNSIASVNFGKLDVGTYHAIIKGTNGSKEDAIEYEFTIVESAQEVKDKETVSINNNAKITPTKNPIVLEIYNKDVEQYLEYIEFIETTVASRLDTRIVYNKIQEIKDNIYGTSSSINSINTDKYVGERALKNLESGEEDIVLTALVNYYAKEYCSNVNIELQKADNLFEYYLFEASNNEPVLLDLLYLKEEEDLDNYNKLLLTLSLEFVGDYENARDLYNNINLSEQEKDEYLSIIAIIDTFINKENAITEINDLIENNPADEYVRFAILSFFENNSTDLEKQETVKVITNSEEKTFTINGLKVETYTINAEDLSTIKFETSSEDLMVSYYYQTSLENIESENIQKDITISLDGDIEKDSVVNLVIEFENDFEGDVRIALPNSLRLARDYEGQDTSASEDKSNYYLQSNNIDYITFYKEEKCSTMKIPLIVSLEGNYNFENIVCLNNGIYHISNSIDFKVK